MVLSNQVERFWQHVDITPGCWEWTGTLQSAGYGHFYLRNENASAGQNRSVYMLAHRFAYELLIGPIPGGLTIDHVCRNRACVNPSHLEPVTSAENNRRAAAVRTTCPQGHEFTPDNTYVTPANVRHCRTCKRANDRAYHAKNRAAA